MSFVSLGQAGDLQSRETNSSRNVGPRAFLPVSSLEASSRVRAVAFGWLVFGAIACAPLPPSGTGREGGEQGTVTSLPGGPKKETPPAGSGTPRGPEREVSGAYTSGPTASGARAGADAAPGHGFDAHAVPDAVPRDEPRSRYGNKSPYVVFGKSYTVLADARGYYERGVASWYGAKFHGAKTSSGEPYDMYAMSAAHKTLPLPCYARVTNLETGASVIVRVNDRGPFKDNRVMDLSYAAATRLGITAKGTGLVEVRVVGPGDVPVVAVDATAAAPPPPPKPAIAPLTDSDLALAAPGTAQVAAAPEAALLPVQPTMWLQVGAFGERANAERVRAQLDAAGIGTATLVETVSNGKLLIKVRLGPFAAVEAMDAATAKVKALGYTQYKAVIE